MKLTFIGGGNMAQALITGLKDQQHPMGDITVIELNAEKRAQLESNFGVMTSDEQLVTNADIILLAIKPQQLAELAKSIAPQLKQQLVISIAAGIRTEDLSRWMNHHEFIVRCMPNTPAQIQQGITALYAMPKVKETQKAAAEQLLTAVGSTLWLDDENKIDAITAISGSGPAYVFYLIEALHAAALELGLDASQAQQLSMATFKGASLLADSSTTSVSELRKQVTSKGGTTEQGLIALEDANIRSIIQLAAQRAFERAQSLGDELGKQ